MTTCATCARALQPDWKFCIYCGTPTGAATVDGAQDAEPLRESEPELEPESDDLDGDEFDLVDYDAELDDLRTVDGSEPEPAPEPATAGPARSRPLPAPVDVSRGFDHLEPVALPETAPSRDAIAPDAVDEDDDGYPFDDDPIDLPDDADGTRSPSIASLTAGLPAASARPSDLPDEPSDSHADAPDPADAPERRPDRTGSVNRLAVIALALGILLSPLAALFGHLALNQLKTSGEKGVVPAWIAVVLGYVWLGAAIVLGITYFAMNA